VPQVAVVEQVEQVVVETPIPGQELLAMAAMVLHHLSLEHL
jgi:hypothetical protein